MISYPWAGMGICGVYIPLYSHKDIPIPVKLA